MTEQKIYAIAYARVSTDDHDQNPESQFVAIRQFAKERNIEIVAEFSDKVSGTTDAREGLYKVYGFKISNPTASMLIVLDADRLSRDMDDSTIILKRLNDLGLKVVYVADENLDLTKKEGKLINTMKAYAAQSYVDDLKIKIRAGQQRARLEGKQIGRPSKRTGDAIDCDMLITFAKNGYSLRKLEKTYKCNKNTLSRKLQECGRLDEFKQEYENAIKRAKQTTNQ